MNFPQDQAKQELAALVSVLDPILSPFGFAFSSGESGVSSGGGFANGIYRDAANELGLIYRGAKLGCPSYASDGASAGHHELMRELGRAEDCALWFDSDQWSVIARRGLTVTEALVSDLNSIVLPCISQSPTAYRSALARAIEGRMNRLRSLR